MQKLFILMNTIAILTGMMGYLIMDLICISLINDTEHLSMYMLALCMSPFAEMSIQVFFINEIIWMFLLLSYRSSLHIFHINPLSNIWFAAFFVISNIQKQQKCSSVSGRKKKTQYTHTMEYYPVEK